MEFIQKLLSAAVDYFKTKPNVAQTVEIPRVVDNPIFRENQKLSEHFSLYELTVTSNASLQRQNRTLTNAQIEKLRVVAQHAEAIRDICGGLPINIHSGYRCVQLNGATLGSSGTSQHPRCEAIDLSVQGQTVQQSFSLLLAAAKTGRFTFGQLIIERAQRSYGSVEWIHCSVIGTLDPAKVGQVLKMEAGLDGKSKYVLIEKLKFV